MEELLFTLPAFLIISILGMLTHFFKKQIKGETITEIRDYFKDHFKSTFTAIIITILACCAYYIEFKTGKPTDIITVFGLGYTFDSMFNKWDK